MENKRTVLLGFLDEIVSEKYKEQLDYSVNKIGGIPDFPNNSSLDIPKCPVCQLQRPLVSQIYAPLENTAFHRTLYLFGCINPTCWQSDDSWLCIRAQSPQTVAKSADQQTLGGASTKEVVTWCADAEDWDTEDGDNLFEISTGKEEITSHKNDLEIDFANMTMEEEPTDTYKAGTAVATAEIEALEDKNIILETPTLPERNIAALLHEETPVSLELLAALGTNRETPLQFDPYFMSVWSEDSCSYAEGSGVNDNHVKDLLKRYESSTENITVHLQEGSGPTPARPDDIPENYESSSPAHGDKMFHQFLSRIQISPEQILRYCRNSRPLLLYPLQDIPRSCRHCQGVMTFEFQLVPTLISKLRLNTDKDQVARLDFGTVLVFTCKNSCWSSDSRMKIETVVLQKEIY